MDHLQPPLSGFEKLKLQVKSLSAGLVMLLNLFLYRFWRQPKPPLKTVLNNVAMRTLLRLSTVREIQHLMPSSLSTWQSWTAKHNLPADVEEISTSSSTTVRILWLGPRLPSTKNKGGGGGGGGGGGKLLFYVHGGGFELPLQPGHIEFLHWLQHSLSVSTSIAILAYSTAPDHKYPTQFREAVEALKSLLERGMNPSDIILAGDSAGGHVLLSVLSHILHPHASIPRLPTLHEPFAAAILISPCVTMMEVHNHDSLRSCEKFDLITRHLIEGRWKPMISSSSSSSSWEEEEGYWGSAIDAPADWWTGLSDRATRKLCVTVGECEIFRDDVTTLVKDLRSNSKIGREEEVEFLMAKTETHDAPLMDGSEALKEEKAMEDVAGESSRTVLEWCREAFGG